MMPSLSNVPGNWFCCQIGAREHYAIARGLAQDGSLRALLTDAWVPPGGLFGRLNPKLRERFHPALAGATVKSWTPGLLALELSARVRKLNGWGRIQVRNHWFQQQAVTALKRLLPEPPVGSGNCPPPVVFAYSYAARDVFKFARARGWQAILGQIDPAIREEQLVGQLHQQSPDLAGDWAPAPAGYWDAWREECALADRILVNSDWSRQALVAEGIPESKLAVIPLAYEPPPAARDFIRRYPEQFTARRPLRVLFLGQINLRKGMACVLEAIRLLAGQPVEWWFVGAPGMRLPGDFFHRPGVRFFGPQPRSRTAGFYRDADVFLFPTMSDGFGLTQLEAMAWRLPVIASRQCGTVVQPSVNGLQLETVTPENLAQAVAVCLEQPARLARLAAACQVGAGFGLSVITRQLQQLASGIRPGQ